MPHKLSRLAEVHNIAVVVTNQVQSQPDDFSAGRDCLRATGGNVMGHATTYRILLSVVRPHIGDIIAYQHGLHFCQEVYPYRNQNKVSSNT
jgi:RecA/RadA recombinase